MAERRPPTGQPAPTRRSDSRPQRKMLAYGRALHIIQSAMRIHAIDLAIVVVYLLGVTGLGVWFRRGQRGGLEGDCQEVSRDYFLGGRTAPWWALAFSIVATETSTLTIIGTPAISYSGNLAFLQVVFGYFLCP